MYLRNVHWEGPFNFKGNGIGSLKWATRGRVLSNYNGTRVIVNGVYVIWSVENSTIIYVGSGDIWDRTDKHQNQWDDPVKLYIDNNPNVELGAAYIELNAEEDFKGAENYLGYVYRPFLRRELNLKEDEKYPNKIPREVDLLPNKYFKTSPVSEESTPYDINLDNWDEYRKAFCKWAEEQHGEDFAEPQKEDNH